MFYFRRLNLHYRFVQNFHEGLALIQIRQVCDQLFPLLIQGPIPRRRCFFKFVVLGDKRSASGAAGVWGSGMRAAARASSILLSARAPGRRSAVRLVHAILAPVLAVGTAETVAAAVRP